jgi:predicted RNase H-like HicB family nuclease
VKSRSSAKAGKRPTVEHVREAAKMAVQYQVSVWSEDGHWYGRCAELPNCLGDGDTADACVASVREAVVAGLAADLADGLGAPAPARQGIRTEQVNVRMSLDERSAIEAAASRLGFRGISDYMRSAAIGFRR